MSVELCPVSEPDGNNEASQNVTMEGNKPLHRFLRCQPKIIGTALLVIGASLVIVAFATYTDDDFDNMFTILPREVFMGTLLMFCGSLYIVTQHRPTKKTVTISFALSIASTFGGFLTIHLMLREFTFYYGLSDYEHSNDTNITNDMIRTSQIETIWYTKELIFFLHSIVGTITFIIMSFLAGAALRSTKTQATIVITATAAEAPIE